MVRATINYQTHSFPDGISILTALQSLHLEVPTLCHDERLPAVGSCRLCEVNVQGLAHPVAACVTPLRDGMVIETHAPDLERERRSLLQMEAKHYPADVVTKYPAKPFHRWLLHYGVVGDCIGTHDPALRDDAHPYINVDMSQCITCYRCVRICEDLQGQFVWREDQRGADTRIVPDSGTTLRASSCVSCGACVEACPTGALEDHFVLQRGMPDKWTKTTCPYCGTGCEMFVGTKDNHIVTVKPAQDAPVNKGHLCVKGRYAHQFVYADDRVTSPLIRRRGAWETVSWEEAIQFTADQLQAILARAGADSIGVLGSARSTNEENYVAQKFARVVLGTNNVDCCARVCHAPTAAAMKMTLGTGAATNSFDDIERANTMLICGCNPTENHPIVGARIKQAARRGAKLIVIDPRRIELADYAQIHLQLRPGTNVPLLNAMACTVIEEKLYHEKFVTERIVEWPEYEQFIRAFTPETVAEVCGVDAPLIRAAARLYAQHGPALCMHGLGMTEHTQGTEGVMCLVNLALLTGNIGIPGAGINPLRGQNNVQGAAHMGCEPNNLTGFVGLAQGQELFERVWQTSLPLTQGLNLMQMMDTAAAGRLKALWAIGYDILLTNANVAATRQALRNLDLVIVQDMFLNETAKEFAHVFLPAASSFEKDGTFMNAERRVQRVRQTIAPLGQAKTDWEILCEVARAMGKDTGFAFQNAEEIWDEVRTVWAVGSGISYQRLEQSGLQWPCPDEAHPGTTLLHQDSFALGPKAALQRIAYRPTTEITDATFPFLLTTGRTLYQFNAGTMTRRTANTELCATDYLDIAPADAASLLLSNDDEVRLISRHGAVWLPIRINTAIKAGELFTTFHHPALFINQITSAQRDRYVGAPEYKVTAVRLEKTVADQG